MWSRCSAPDAQGIQSRSSTQKYGNGLTRNSKLPWQHAKRKLNMPNLVAVAPTRPKKIITGDQVKPELKSKKDRHQTDFGEEQS